MTKTEMAVGQLVMFGRNRGERTLGRVIKVNRQRVKVVQLTKRGSLKDYPVGTIWMVPPSLTVLATAEEASQAETVPEGVNTKPVSIEMAPGTSVGKESAMTATPPSTEAATEPQVATAEKPTTEPKKRGRKPRVKENPPDTMVLQEKGCPVIVDPSTGYRFVGHKGESVFHFAGRVQDILRGNLTPAERAEVSAHNIH